MADDTQAVGLEPESIALEADDGFPIKGFLWRAAMPHEDRGATERAGPGQTRSVVIVNAATSVRCRYYFRFATYLATHGFDVIVYDYRGIGESRPARLRGFPATWLDWGRLDFEAVLRFAQHAFAGRPIDVVAHSIGGFVVGLAPSNAAIRRVFTVGAQYAYWRDYAPRARLGMLLKWHVAMPVLAVLFGYVPAGRLGWMEDTPRGVALSWSRSRARFEDTYRRAPLSLADDERNGLVRQFAQLAAPVLAVSVTDDPFGTTPAIERLLDYFTGSETRTHVRIAPAYARTSTIGHFAFFHRRFEGTLWPMALHWLETGALIDELGDSVVARYGACTRDAQAQDPLAAFDAADARQTAVS